MRIRVRPGVALLLAALAVRAAAAMAPSEDLAALPLDALLDMQVTGASRFAQRMSDSAASVTVITADEIRALGWRTLGQALRSVRGVMVTNDRIYDYIGVRGFFSAGDYNTRVLLLIDGNRVNDALYDQAYIGAEFPLDLALVERIEFIPGQGSAVYGANALFGVVNVITRAPSAQHAAAAGASVGSGGRRELRALARRELGDGTLLLAASRQLAHGEDLEDPAQGVSHGTDYERRNAVYLRYDRGRFSASLVHGDRLKGVPLYPGLIFGDPRTRYRDEQTLANLEWHAPIAERSELTARVFAGDYRFTGDFAIDYPPPTINRDVSHGRWWGAEARVFSAALDGHKLVAGAELQRSPQLFQGNFDVDGPSYLDDHRRASRYALFAEDQLRLMPSLVATVGLRADRVNHSTQVSPRVALNWKPTGTLVLKAIHGRAFRPPNAYEAYYQVDGPGGYRRNPDIGPERVRGNELALEWLPADDLRVAASLFHNRASSLIVLDYDAAADLYEFRNGGALVSRGLELELERAWRSGARLRANFTLQRTHSDSALVQAEQFPHRMAKFTALWPLPARWMLGFELQALSRRGAAPGHAVAHAALSRPVLVRGLGVTLGVRNLFDRALVDPGFDAERQPLTPLPGREWQLALDWAF
jgi:outer membrane receptor protein involved in Fe transport